MTKRTDYISWNEYFMGICLLSAQRSKDPNTQVGSCIVDNNNHIVSIGYNGFPNGCSDDILPWSNNKSNPIENKYCYVVHAEINAILNKNKDNLNDCTLYVTLFPCYECAKIIIQTGIKNIIYLKYKEDKATERMFDLSNIKYSKYNEANKIINIIV